MSPRPVRVVHANPADAAAVERDELLDRWWTTTRTVETLAAQGVDVRLVGRTTGEAFALVRDGITHRFVHDRSRGLRRLARAVGALHPDVVHLHGTGFAAAALALRARARRAAIVVQHHGEPPPATARARTLARLAAPAIDGWLFTGGVGNARGFGAGRAGTPPVTAVHDVLEASSDFAPVPRAGARARTGVHGAPAVLWVGRATADKDPATAVAAFARLAAGAPDAQLWMLCTEAPSDDARAALLAAAGDRRDRVHVRGPVPHAEMPDWFSAADVLVTASRHEAAGYAVLEALACGCPVAATDLAPHRTILGAAAPATTFAPGDAAGGARAIAAALERPRDQVRADFTTRASWPEVGAQLRAAYDAARGS